MPDETLRLIDRPSEGERLEAFEVPSGEPYYWRPLYHADLYKRWPVPVADNNVLCGSCRRVLAAGMTLGDLWDSGALAKDKDKRIWLCSCGAYLLVPARRRSELATIEDLIKRTQKSALQKRPLRKTAPPTDPQTIAKTASRVSDSIEIDLSEPCSVP